MNHRKLFAIVGLTIVLCLFLTLFAGVASAQDTAAAQGSDKRLSTKKGMDVLGGDNKKKGENEGPSTLQMAVGVGSVFVMIAVVKWL